MFDDEDHDAAFFAAMNDLVRYVVFGGIILLFAAFAAVYLAIR